MYFFIYRQPGSTDCIGYKSGNILNGLHPGGFAICPFDKNPAGILSIPADEPMSLSELDMAVGKENGGKTHSNSSLYCFPTASTAEKEHIRAVQETVDSIREGKMDKCVIARVELMKGSMNLSDTFATLCAHNPDAFVFCFHTPQSGIWIGATPETLLSKRGDELRTMALAGTRENRHPAGKWDEKNIAEQAFVKEYIGYILSGCGLEAGTENTYTKPAGKIEHICTEMTYKAIPSLPHPISLATRLSPTPAVCGMPVHEAMDAIKVSEKFERGYYGGFCGPYRSNGDFDLYVILRCAWVGERGTCLYAGGGITADSSPESEWIETMKKTTTIKNCIKHQTL